MDESVNIHGRSFKPFISEQDLKEKVQEVAKEVSRLYANENPLLICVLKGSFIFASDFYRELSFLCDIHFMKLKSYSGFNSTGEIQQELALNIDIQDRTLIIIEDIVDSGKTLEYLRNELLSQGAKRVVIVSLLYKPDAFKGNYQIDYTCFSIPNKFVVGYGLDYDGLGRNLKGLYQLKEAE